MQRQRVALHNDIALANCSLIGILEPHRSAREFHKTLDFVHFVKMLFVKDDPTQRHVGEGSKEHILE